jgi:hypothetical protein
MRGKDPKLAKPSRPKIVIFGKAGVGKTFTALDWPDAYFIDCEGGASLPHYTDKLKKVGALYMGPEDGANDFKVVLEEVQELATTKHDRKTLIVDSFSKLFGTAIQVENDRLVKQGAKTDFGVDKKPAISATRRLVKWLDRIDMNVILICHEKPVWKNGEQIGTSFDGWDKLEYELNLVLRIEKQGTARKAVVQKSRFVNFDDGERVDFSYEEFASRFGADVMEHSSVPIVLASDVQVDELRGLIDAVNFDTALLEKWREKAGVEKWSEMDTVTIDKCIKHLRGQVPTT